jgi:hypothetical protein
MERYVCLQISKFSYLGSVYAELCVGDERGCRFYDGRREESLVKCNTDEEKHTPHDERPGASMGKVDDIVGENPIQQRSEQGLGTRE